MVFQVSSQELSLVLQGLWQDQLLVFLRLLEKLQRVSGIEVGYTKWDLNAIGSGFLGLYQMGPQCYRVRLPRPLRRELNLRPYSLEEAVGTSVLMEADVGLNLKNEVLVMCKSLKQGGKFAVVTERLVLTVSSPGLVDLGKPEFRGVPIDPEWLVESEISLDSVIHGDAEEEVVHIVGTRSDAVLKQNQHQSKKGVLTQLKIWNNPISLPLSLTNLELASSNDAKELLQILLSMIARGKERRPGSGYVLHRSNIM